MAASASITTTTPTPIPAFVPSVMFDMMVEDGDRSSIRAKANNVELWIDGDDGAVRGIDDTSLKPKSGAGVSMRKI